jgi:hypothetical protein
MTTEPSLTADEPWTIFEPNITLRNNCTRSTGLVYFGKNSDNEQARGGRLERLTLDYPNNFKNGDPASQKALQLFVELVLHH